jgi:hypothetical protein
MDRKNGLIATLAQCTSFSLNEKLKIITENGNFWAGKNDISIREKGYYLPCVPHTRKSPNIPSFPLFLSWRSH